MKIGISRPTRNLEEAAAAFDWKSDPGPVCAREEGFEITSFH